MEITIRINKSDTMDWINGDGNMDNDELDTLANRYADFISKETGYPVLWGDVSGYAIEFHGLLSSLDDIDEDEVNINVEAAMAKAANWEWVK